MAWAGIEGAREQHKKLIKVMETNYFMFISMLLNSDVVANNMVSDFEQREYLLGKILNWINTAGVPE